MFEVVTGEEEPDVRPPFPWVVVLLVVANLAMYLLQLKEGDSFTAALASIPYELTHDTDLTDAQLIAVRGAYVVIEQAPGPHPIYLTLLTSMFLHASWTHLLGNMLFLVLFGPPIERRTGPFRFITFYVFCGLVASVADVLTAPESMVHGVGASGAISGILGAYVLTFPLSEIPFMVRLLTVGLFPGMPAVAVFGFWLLMQYLQFLNSAPGVGGTAFMAHIAGFLTGLVLAAFIVPNPPPPKPRRHGWISH